MLPPPPPPSLPPLLLLSVLLLLLLLLPLLMTPPPPPLTPTALFSSLLQLRWCLYPMHIGTFRFKTLAVPPPPLTLLRRDLGGSEVLRRTCQTGLLRPTWTPPRPGLLGHFLDLDSPAELLREQGALFTFRVNGAPAKNLGRVPAFPADLLREKGHMLMFNSAELVEAPLFLSFLFPFSFSSMFSVLFLSVFLKMSLQRLEAEEEEGSVKMEGEGSGSGGEPGSGSGSWMGGVKVEGLGEGCGLFGRRWRGRRTPSTKSSSAERRLG